MSSSFQKFLRQTPVFSYAMFLKALQTGKTRSHSTCKALLAHHIKQGHIARVRRGLFAAIPAGADAKIYPINPYLIAGYLTNDAVLGYHTALTFYNIAYSTSYRFVYLSQQKLLPFDFRDETYQSVSFPRALKNKNQRMLFVNMEDVKGMNVHVTSLERTLVDVMDRPQLGGGWEEIWRSLDMIKQLKVERVIRYTLLLNNAATIAKVGYYLEQRQDEFKVSKSQLNKLRAHIPTSPRYMNEASRGRGKLIVEWNLIVPDEIIKKTWDEPFEDIDN
jgi:predicted transcriptional regulator of viral defense system